MSVDLSSNELCVDVIPDCQTKCAHWCNTDTKGQVTFVSNLRPLRREFCKPGQNFMVWKVISPKGGPSVILLSGCVVQLPFKCVSSYPYVSSALKCGWKTFPYRREQLTQTQNWPKC